MNKIYLIVLITIFSFKSIAMDPPQKCLWNLKRDKVTRIKKMDLAHCQKFKDKAIKQLIRNIKNGSVDPKDAYAQAFDWFHSNDPLMRRLATVIFAELVKYKEYTDISLKFANRALGDQNFGVRNAALEIYIPLVRKGNYIDEATFSAENFYNNINNFHPYSVNSFWRLNRELVAHGRILDVANKMAFQCMNTNPIQRPPNFTTISPTSLAIVTYENWLAALEFYTAAVEQGKFISFGIKAFTFASSRANLKAATEKLGSALTKKGQAAINLYYGNSKNLVDDLLECRSMLADGWRWGDKSTKFSTMKHIKELINKSERTIMKSDELKNNPLLVSLILLNYAELLKYDQMPSRAYNFAKEHMDSKDEWTQQAFEIFVKENVKYLHWMRSN